MTIQEMEARIIALEGQLASKPQPRANAYVAHIRLMNKAQLRLGHDNASWAHGVGKGLGDVVRGTLGIQRLPAITEDEQQMEAALVEDLLRVIEKYNWKRPITPKVNESEEVDLSHATDWQLFYELRRRARVIPIELSWHQLEPCQRRMFMDQCGRFGPVGSPAKAVPAFAFNSAQ